MAYRFAPTMVLWPYFRWRGQDQVLCRSGIEGAIAFLKETQELMDMVLKTGGWQTLTLDVTSADREDRETNRRAMLNFLGISEVQVYPPALAAALQTYTGMYVAEEPESSIRTLEVRIEQDRLVLYRPGMRLGPPVPVSATRLHLMSTPVDVEFVLEEAWGRSTVSRAPLVERRDTCLSPILTPKERRSEAHALVLAACGGGGRPSFRDNAPHRAALHWHCTGTAPPSRSADTLDWLSSGQRGHALRFHTTSRTLTDRLGQVENDARPRYAHAHERSRANTCLQGLVSH